MVSLGSGSFGDVFAGTYKGAQVAVKRIRLSELEVNEEQDAMLNLDHPNVLKLFRWEDDNDFKYLALELCDGTLADFLSGKYQGAMPADFDALLQMAAGVEHIHSNNLVHRDLKPNNILIAQQTLPLKGVLLKISDFGFCKKTTNCGTFPVIAFYGTRLYMSPELLAAMGRKEENVRGSTKGDVFALGCVFFEFLTRGTHPFGDDIFSPVWISRGEFNLAGLSSDHFAFNLVKQMIQLEPEDRPTASDVTEELERQRIKTGSLIARNCYENGETGGVFQCLFHPFKAKLACALQGGRVCIFSAPDPSTPFQQWDQVTWKAATNEALGFIDWNVDGTKLAAASVDGTLVVWEENGTKSLEMKKHSGRIRCIQWNKVAASSHLLVTGGEDETAVVWDCNMNIALQTFEFYNRSVNCVTWISADVFASASKDALVKICQIGRSTPVKTLRQREEIGRISWMAEDRRLVSCSKDESITIWSLDQSDPIAKLDYKTRGFSFDVHQSIAEDDPRWLIAGQGKPFVCLLDVKPNGMSAGPRTLEGHSLYVGSVAFSPGGRSVASFGLDFTPVVNDSDSAGTEASRIYLKVVISSTQSGDVFFHGEIQSTDMPCYSSAFHLSWLSCGNKLAMTGETSEVHVVEFDT